MQIRNRASGMDRRMRRHTTVHISLQACSDNCVVLHILGPYKPSLQRNPQTSFDSSLHWAAVLASQNDVRLQLCSSAFRNLLKAGDSCWQLLLGMPSSCFDESASDWQCYQTCRPLRQGTVFGAEACYETFTAQTRTLKHTSQKMNVVLCSIQRLSSLLTLIC